MPNINELKITLKNFLNKKFLIAILGYFIFVAIFAFLSKALANIKLILKIDVAIQEIIVSTRSDLITTPLIWFTDLGDAQIVIIWTIIATLAFYWKRHYIYAIGIITTVGVTEFISLILKDVIGRHRPPEFIALVSETSPSFPSGHTIAAVSFFGFLIYFFYKNIENKSLRNLLMFICGFAIFLAGFTRIYLGAHWPSDTFASYIIAGIWLIIVIWLIEKYLKNTQS